MKAELDEKGVLVVKAETTVESFALTQWFRMYEKQEAHFLISTIERANDGSGALDATYQPVVPHSVTGSIDSKKRGSRV